MVYFDVRKLLLVKNSSNYTYLITTFNDSKQFGAILNFVAFRQRPLMLKGVSIVSNFAVKECTLRPLSDAGVRERVTRTKQFCLSVLYSVPRLILYRCLCLAEHAPICKIVTRGEVPLRPHLHETGTK